jgi:hypothetical protein
MVKLFGKGKEEEHVDDEFQRELAAGEQHPPPGQMLTEDYVNSLGRSVYMVMDPDVMKILNDDDQLKTLIPAASHLNRLTKKDRGAMQLDMLDYEFLLMIHKLNMKEDEYETSGWAKLQAFIPFFRNLVYDSVDGFKAKVVTEQIKVIKAELEKKRKKVLPF